MKTAARVPLLLLLVLASLSPLAVRAGEGIDATYGPGPHAFRLATGSPGELGLVQALAGAFAPGEKAALGWKKAGSGQSLLLLRDKAVDLIMVHAPQAEKDAVAQGWATQRTLLGSNEFYIVGPASDPAGIAQAASAKDAYGRIARAGAKFFSRGDNSGTHQKELAIWHQSGIEPQGDWYLVTRSFMKATLQRANDEAGYFMTDSSTWVQEAASLPGLKILFRGDKFLVNTYHALRQPDGATPGAALAGRFIAFMASPAGQKIIREYGGGLYNDAAYARQYDD
jgi:tungstate transport system substrate-binding protein